jgi:hypothetical protein
MKSLPLKHTVCMKLLFLFTYTEHSVFPMTWFGTAIQFYLVKLADVGGFSMQIY